MVLEFFKIQRSLEMNKTALVTGATNGTGYAIARRFAREGFDVYITSREKERANESAKKLTNEVDGKVQVLGVELGVNDEKEVYKLFAEVKSSGRIVSKMVLNAANLGIGLNNFFDIDINEWMEVYKTNIRWNFLLAQQAAKQMRDTGTRGSIVFIGSETGIRAIKSRTAYCSSKTAVHGLARTLAVELGTYGIRVNTVVAGMIKTERWYAREDIRNAPTNKVPLGDVCEFDDIANAAWFLSSDDARIITGAELAVDGGLLAQLVYEEKGI
jgi:NAD(P)-dependent dehydrogenase (short-subunit alcohol dehydrogenase family)